MSVEGFRFHTCMAFLIFYKSVLLFLFSLTNWSKFSHVLYRNEKPLKAGKSRFSVRLNLLRRSASPDFRQVYMIVDDMKVDPRKVTLQLDFVD